jgi:ADP-ribose pyrophosphatase YjhB (NUDIX family)
MPLERAMISFRTPAGLFQFRTAAVVIRDGHVLLQRIEPDPYWFLPGGRVELGESAEAAIEREMREETGASVRIERMLWVVENFFGSIHEIGFYFLVTMPSELHPNLAEQFFGHEDDGTRLTFQWHRIADLGGIDIRPSFLREGLKSLPTTIRHIVQKDDRAL